jgi:hypothetical protein
MRIETPFSVPKELISIVEMVKFLGLHTSDRPEKKYYVVLVGDSGREKRVYFGDAASKDFTLFSPLEREERKRRYISRHSAREDWTKSGIETAGFWSKHILWNLPTVSASLAATRRKFNI